MNIKQSFWKYIFVCSSGVGDKGPKQRRPAGETETNGITAKGQTCVHRQLMRHRESSNDSFLVCLFNIFEHFSVQGGVSLVKNVQ